MSKRLFVGGALFSLFFLMLSLPGCEPKKLEVEPGKCYLNEHCPQGTRCVGNRCQDIYYPKKDIIQ